MTQISSLPDYAEINAALHAAKTNLNAAQTHGMLCGLIAATGGQLNEPWDKLLFGNKKIADVSDMLQQLLEISYHQMSEFSFEFNLLLPDDDADINFRTENLGLWCQGFLTGLEKGNVPLKNRPESEVTEALNDILAISQVSFGDITDSEEDETAYFELVEHVRLAALMIFQELCGPQAAPNTELH